MVTLAGGRPLLDTHSGNVRAAGDHHHQQQQNQQQQQPGGPVAAAGASSEYKKPPFTYTELIEQALREKGELTVSGIYKWISQNFPYYRPDDDRWKNSVRHNLSINPYFTKGSKARKGAGHLWTVVRCEDRSRSSWVSYSDNKSFDEAPISLPLHPLHPIDYHVPGILRKATKRRRLEQFVSEQRRREAAAQQRELVEAAMHIARAPDEDKENHEQLAREGQGWITTQIISLEQSAEDILSGVKREVEVEYLTAIPQDEDGTCASADSTDFLNPVSKLDAVKESGLLSDEGLGVVHLSDLILPHDHQDDILFSDEEMNLQYYELALAAANQ